MPPLTETVGLKILALPRRGEVLTMPRFFYGFDIVYTGQHRVKMKWKLESDQYPPKK